MTKTKNDARIIAQDYQNGVERLKRGFINRWQERRARFPKRKWNCRKQTEGRIAYRLSYLGVRD
jgi:hypothetical protein